MTHSEYRTQIEKLFPEYADQDIIIDIIENQMIPEDIPFCKFYHLYQDLHLKKHGEYLQIPIK